MEVLRRKIPRYGYAPREKSVFLMTMCFVTFMKNYYFLVPIISQKPYRNCLTSLFYKMMKLILREIIENYKGSTANCAVLPII